MAAGWKDALMADTGAPWNIPYVEPSDLVRDYPAADEAQALAIAAGLSDALAAGIGDNVVQAVKTDTFSTTSATYVDITGLEVTITPTVNTSKILIVSTVNIGGVAGEAAYVQLLRDSTALFIGDAASSRVRATVMGRLTDVADPASVIFVDSPGTDLAVTYKLQARRGSGSTAFINRSSADADNAAAGRLASSLIAIEVKA
jgi:hypothetical protein